MKIELLKNFIVFEGLDGAGTSTQSRLLADKIPASYLTFEPTNNTIGIIIRDCLQKKIELNPLSLAFLFVADRTEHLYGKNGIIERCRKNEIVISDRYLFSSLAYQSLDLPFNQVYEMNMNFPLPELTFFLNTSTNECQKRIASRGEEKELFEQTSLQERILQNYLKAFELYKKTGARVVFLDGNQSIDSLLNQEMEYLNKSNFIN